LKNKVERFSLAGRYSLAGQGTYTLIKYQFERHLALSQSFKTFYVDFRNKLEILALASLSSLV
jgi:hypothetical protein